MATNKSMASRIQRVQAAARKKKIAELEGAATSPRKQVIAELEASLKQAAGVKSKSKDKDDGKGKKPGATAEDKFNRKKVQPKPKGKKDESKLNKATGDADPVGYPFGNGDTKGNLGKGKPKAKSKKSKQTALNEADKKRQDLTSKTPALKKTPKPKISSADRNWRRAKIAELKQALLSGQAPDSEMDTEEVSPKDMQDVTGKATKEQRVPAAQVLQQAQKLVPMLTQQLQQANDMLEDAVMGSDLQKIKGALTFLLTKIQEITKGQIVPLGATIRKLMSSLSPKQASSEKYASVVRGAHMVAKLDEEFLRSKHLMRMAANRISL